MSQVPKDYIEPMVKIPLKKFKKAKKRRALTEAQLESVTAERLWALQNSEEGGT